jgi:hypothetical protein
MFKASTRTLLLLVSAGLSLFPGIVLSAHSDSDSAAILEELEANRRLVVAENMTVAAAMPEFWAVYDAYRQEIAELEGQGFDQLREFRDHFEEIDDTRANDLLLTYFKLEQEKLTVRSAYRAKFNEVISPKKTLRFYQVESKLDSIIRSDISAVTPLVPDAPEAQ